MWKIPQPMSKQAWCRHQCPNRVRQVPERRVGSPDFLSRGRPSGILTRPGSSLKGRFTAKVGGLVPRMQSRPPNPKRRAAECSPTVQVTMANGVRTVGVPKQARAKTGLWTLALMACMPIMATTGSVSSRPATTSHADGQPY